MINLKKLQEIGLLIKDSHDDSNIYNTIFKTISESIKFDYGTLFLNDADNYLKPIYSKNEIIIDLASDFIVGDGSGIAGWVSDNKNPVIFPNFMKKNPNRKFNSFVSVPLIIDEKHIGVLNLGHKKTDFFKKEDENNFNILGSQIAIIIDKINIKKELQLKNDQLSSALQQLKESQKKLVEKEKFASMGEMTISLKEEINNPLSVIMGFSDLLLQKCKNNSLEPVLLLEKLEMILDSAHKINTILHYVDKSKFDN